MSEASEEKFEALLYRRAATAAKKIQGGILHVSGGARSRAITDAWNKAIKKQRKRKIS